MTEPSEKYFEALRLTRAHHDGQNKTFSGRFVFKNHRHRVKSIIDQYDIKSILDYGAGKGKQYLDIDENGQTLEQYWGIETTKYDPGVQYYSREPTGKFDLVICVQVLGSIPRVDLPWVVDRLYGFANKVVFVAERLTIPRKQIYASMAKDMPHGLSDVEWRDILRRPGTETPKMLVAFKGEGFDWGVEEVN